MTIDTKTMISISEVNQNFSKAARLVDSYGSALVLKNNAPKYLIIDYSQLENSAVSDEEVFAVSQRLMERNHKVYEELAK